MKLIKASIAAASLSACAHAQEQVPARMAPPDVRAITPALADYTDEVLFGDVWKRPGLSPRDRSLVTVSALIAGNHTAQMTGHFNRALDNGVKPSELSAVITHLAFYSGWPRAMSAVPVAKDVFTRRNIDPEQAMSVEVGVLPQPSGEAERAGLVEAQLGEKTPALAGYTNEILFGDLWRRDDLTPRDRSLVTVSALIAAGQTEQAPFHLSRALANGVTQVEISELITHLAFYAGWPRAMSAVPLAKAAFEAPQQAASATQSPTMLTVLRADASPPTTGSPENFTGGVSVDSPFRREAPARVGGAVVTFSPGARTAWHTHPLGQTLVVTAGCGLVQQEGGPVETIRVGDVALIPPGARHWHGATPTTSMTHVAISEAAEGQSVSWMEHVTDQAYRAGNPAC